MTKLSALFRLFLRHQMTTGRIALMGGFGAVWLAISVAIRSGAEEFERVSVALDSIGDGLGIGLGVPIIALVLASATLGDLVEDETLVYLWHRPSPRWMTALAAWAASVSVTIPTVALLLGISGAIASGSFTVGWALTLSSALACVAYCGLFCLAGVLIRRSLIWGLLYVFVWETLLTRIFGGLANLSIRSYAVALSEHVADENVLASEHGMATSIVALIVCGFATVLLTTWRLNTMDVA